MKNILKLEPFYNKKIWGYEKWNLSTHNNGHSTITNSKNTLLKKLGKELPIMIKVIKAEDTLSVQVHPDDEYAKTHENDSGKTECWYILEAKEGATLICGLKEGLNKSEFSKIIDSGDVENYLERINVRKGDMIYIPSGTVHAIEDGVKLIEVQQSSDITYRMYDWGRDRELHINKSLDVIDFNGKHNGGKIENFTKLETPYFNIEKVSVDSIYEDVVESDFHSYTVIGGSGFIYSNGEKIDLKNEETIYIPNRVSYKIHGDIELIKAYI
ncbi:type I phosphomannose isomerase catalytic subunit [Paraclostridium sordellii]|uniref:type I phosphomannose isomerase catalytic subunit n=1 Tax=Paraclostridium sordellii TaxID=1505 RepID=UPI001898D970|nr:type I phosphomannose isomerase catalytic subunit [Paeniclostridium sordellii]